MIKVITQAYDWLGALILDIKEVLLFNFPMHLYTNKELCEIAFKMIQYTGLAGTLGVEEVTIIGLIEELAVHYNVIPYHNWTHAF